MPEAWFQDDSCPDHRENNHFDPPKFITLEKLKALSGVECFQVNVDDLKNDNEYWQLRKDRGYDYEDDVEISPKTLGDEYDPKCKLFYTEHLHDFEEIRLFLEGSGYFDVRDKDDNWIRIHAKKSDLLVLPAGCYHRFTPDKTDYVKVLRLFCGNPVWACKFRPEGDSEPSRQHYINNVLLKQAA